MCYLNTIQKFGVKRFTNEIKNIVDGIIIVDLPFEEETSTKKLLDKNNIHLIKLISPMTDKKRVYHKNFVYTSKTGGISPPATC